MTCRPVEWKIQSNSARRPEICNPGSLRRVTRFSPKDKTLAVANVVSTDELLSLFLVSLTLLESVHRATSNQKANLFTGNAVFGMVILFLFLPLTCNRGTKTRGCSTYPDSFSCCISNTVSHYIEAKTRRRRYQKYPCCSFSYGSHSWDQCTVQPPTKKQTCTLEVLCARYWSKSRACFSLDLQQRGEDMGLWHLS